MLKKISPIKPFGSSTKAIIIIALLLAAIWLFSRANIALPEDVKAEMVNLPNDIDYNLDVKPILSDKCFACHGPDAKKQKAGLRLDIDSAAYHKVTGTGLKAITPGNPAKSEMVRRILSNVCNKESLVP